jgi:hypothetical protein
MSPKTCLGRPRMTARTFDLDLRGEVTGALPRILRGRLRMSARRPGSPEGAKVACTVRGAPAPRRAVLRFSSIQRIEEHTT